MDSDRWLHDDSDLAELYGQFPAIIDFPDVLQTGLSSLPLEETFVPGSFLPAASPSFSIKDLGNHSHAPGDWVYYLYNTIEVDPCCLPILINKDVWCEGNNKLEERIDEYTTELNVYLTSNSNQLTPNCRKSKCHSVKAKTCVQINASSRLITSPNSKIQARILCIPSHRSHNETSFSLHFELFQNGVSVALQTLDLGKPRANRSTKRSKQNFLSPPLVIVLISVAQFTFRTTWRASFQQ